MIRAPSLIRPGFLVDPCQLAVLHKLQTLTHARDLCRNWERSRRTFVTSILGRCRQRALALHPDQHRVVVCVCVTNVVYAHRRALLSFPSKLPSLLQIGWWGFIILMCVFSSIPLYALHRRRCIWDIWLVLSDAESESSCGWERGFSLDVPWKGRRPLTVDTCVKTTKEKRSKSFGTDNMYQIFEMHLLTLEFLSHLMVNTLAKKVVFDGVFLYWIYLCDMKCSLLGTTAVSKSVSSPSSPTPILPHQCQLLCLQGELMSVM